MRFLLVLFLGLSVTSVSSAGQGLPLPWPFPWAKECPVDWLALEGRYALSNSEEGEEVQLTIQVVNQGENRMLEVSRYLGSGELVSQGQTYMILNQRTIWLRLYPVDQTQSTESAMIKLYYQSSNLTCSETNLVPIMSVYKTGSHIKTATQYRLLRIKE